MGELDAVARAVLDPEVIALHHADDAVIVEFDLLGTHLGRLRALPPTGRSFRCRMRQLGLAHETTSIAGRLSTLVSHPVTIGRTIVGSLGRRSRAR